MIACAQSGNGLGHKALLSNNVPRASVYGPSGRQSWGQSSASPCSAWTRGKDCAKLLIASMRWPPKLPHNTGTMATTNEKPTTLSRAGRGEGQSRSGGPRVLRRTKCACSPRITPETRRGSLIVWKLRVALPMRPIFGEKRPIGKRRRPAGWSTRINPRPLQVGGDCAGLMEGDLEGARRRDTDFRNR
jgi:hypothetical protein